MADSKIDGDGPSTRNSSVSRPLGRSPEEAAFQVICLGSGGGPSEDNVTGFLVRTIGTNWSKGSMLAVDAGSHLASITRILSKHLPAVSDGQGRTGRERSRKPAPGEPVSRTASLTSNMAHASLSPEDEDEDEMVGVKPVLTMLSEGPFKGLTLPYESARANASHILNTFISSYLITHPHLDHISGFAINTAAFQASSKPKTLAALPQTVDAIKQHIFNDVIWPNLSDEDGGVGFVTFQRLKEGGDPMMGEGEGRGYVEVCDDLSAKAFKVSHGVCTKSGPSHLHRGSVHNMPEAQNSFAGDGMSPAMARSYSISAHQQYTGPSTPRMSIYGHGSPVLTPERQQPSCVVDSTVYFLRDALTEAEVLFFGDVEPDSLSLSPRNGHIWHEAARKIANGCLRGIFIECSYNDDQDDAYLFGHLCPRHLIAELQTLAVMTHEAKAQRALDLPAKKRKRSVWAKDTPELSHRPSSLHEGERKRNRSFVSRLPSQLGRSSSLADHSMRDQPASPMTIPKDFQKGWQQSRTSDASAVVDFTPISPSPVSSRSITEMRHRAASSGSGGASGTMSGGGNGNGGSNGNENSNSTASAITVDSTPALQGIKVAIMHIKDTHKDGPHVSESILAQLLEHEEDLKLDGLGLGCEFIIAECGESYYF